MQAEFASDPEKPRIGIERKNQQIRYDNQIPHTIFPENDPMKSPAHGAAALVLCLLGWPVGEVCAQTFGTDLHNVAQPASGGMAGVSLARPQDAPSALFGNPSTMAQFQGTTFTTGVSWLNPGVYASHDGAVTGALGGGPWNGGSQTQGFLIPNVAALQDLRGLGIQGTAGVGLTALGGLGTNFRNIPASVGTAAELQVYGINAGLGLQLTDNLSIGAAATLALGILDAGFAPLSGMSHAYAPRGTFGAAYNLPMNTTFGVFYQTKLPFVFVDSQQAAPGAPYTDLALTQPDNVGFGLSNSSLYDGNLLIATDILYKQWASADFWRNYYRNQWVFAIGAQYTYGVLKYRLGYSYGQNPINKDAGAAGGPAAQALTDYIQATELPAISKHRITAGLGYCNLLPGMSVDVFAGGLLPQSENFGAHSSSTAFAWYAGLGLTWAFCPITPPSVPAAGLTKL